MASRDLQMARHMAVKVITANASIHTPKASFLCSLAKSLSRLGSETIPPLIEQF